MIYKPIDISDKTTMGNFRYIIINILLSLSALAILCLLGGFGYRLDEYIYYRNINWSYQLFIWIPVTGLVLAALVLFLMWITTSPPSNTYSYDSDEVTQLIQEPSDT